MRENVGGKFVGVNIVSIVVVRQGNEQKGRRREKIGREISVGGVVRVVVEEREGR